MYFKLSTQVTMVSSNFLHTDGLDNNALPDSEFNST